MADYISRQAVIDALEKERDYLLKNGRTGAENILVHHALAVVDEIPAEDVRPVVRGEWKKYRKGIDLQCSRCYWSTDFGIPLNFCPNCGSYNGGDFSVDE